MEHRVSFELTTSKWTWRSTKKTPHRLLFHLLSEQCLYQATLEAELTKLTKTSLRAVEQKLNGPSMDGHHSAQEPSRCQQGSGSPGQPWAALGTEAAGSEGKAEPGRAPVQHILPLASPLRFRELLKFKGRTFLLDLNKQVIEATCSAREGSNRFDPSLATPSAGFRSGTFTFPS